MKTFFCTTILLLSTVLSFGQVKSTVINMDKLTNVTVRAAITALQDADSEDWFALFSEDAVLYDDGEKTDFRAFFEYALGHERFTNIDKVANDGLDVYGRFHSDKWGDFKTYFKFQINSEDKITRLDIGQTNY